MDPIGSSTDVQRPRQEPPRVEQAQAPADAARGAGEDVVRAQQRQPMEPAALQAQTERQQDRGEAARPVTGAPPAARSAAPALPGQALAPGAIPSAQRAIEAARSPQGQEAARQVHQHNQERLQSVPDAIRARSAREHAVEFGRGLKDGVKDTVTGLVQTARMVGRYATDSQFRGDVNRGVAELREAMRTPEGRALVGNALGEGGDKIVAEISRNPAYAAGFVAGSLLTGGPITKAISAASKLGAAGRVVGAAVDRTRQFAQAHSGKLIAGGTAATGGAIVAGDNIVSDVARTGAQAPFASVTGGALAVQGRTRLLAAGGRQHVRQQAEQQAEQRRAPRPEPQQPPAPVLQPLHEPWLYGP